MQFQGPVLELKANQLIKRIKQAPSTQDRDEQLKDLHNRMSKVNDGTRGHTIGIQTTQRAQVTNKSFSKGFAKAAAAKGIPPKVASALYKQALMDQLKALSQKAQQAARGYLAEPAVNNIDNMLTYADGVGTGTNIGAGIGAGQGGAVGGGVGALGGGLLGAGLGALTGGTDEETGKSTRGRNATIGALLGAVPGAAFMGGTLAHDRAMEVGNSSKNFMLRPAQEMQANLQNYIQNGGK